MKTFTLQTFFDVCIQTGIKNDPRGENEVQKYLKSLSEKYESFSEEEKAYFPKEYLTNPYHDSTIYCGERTQQIKKIIVGIDMQWAEILFVNEYNRNNPNAPIDLVVWHHPEGRGLLGIAPLQKSIAPFVATNTGITINIAEKVEFPRVGDIEKRFSPLNHYRAIRFAELLNISYLGLHTPADNCCHTFLENIFKENVPETLGDIINILMEIPEMKISKMNGVGPQIWNGEKESRAGKIAVTGITGGTESSKHIYEEYAKAGIGTILEMHLSQEHLEAAKKANLNVIMTDHMASDSLWINLLLDQFEAQGIEIIDFSGFIRVKRV